MKTALVLVAAVGVALCTAALAGTDPRAEKKQLTKADMALAARSVLRPADLSPEWTATTPSPFDQKAPECPGYAPDFSRFTITGRAHAAFKGPAGARIESEVDVLKTRADARRDFALGAQPLLADCLATLVPKQMQAAGVEAQVVSAKMTSTPRIGERSAFYHLAFQLTAAGQRIPLYIDVVAFLRGRTIGAVDFVNALQPLPDEVGLVQKLAARAAG
jgi:hypothetical protein